MARMRVLKPELPGHEKLAKVSRDARLLFVWIITDCDDVGRFMAAPKRLAGHLYPYDDDVTGSDVSMWLGELVEVGLVELYTVDCGQFGWLPGWSKHQNPSHPSPSRIPAPMTSGNEPLAKPSGMSPETFANPSRNPRASSSSSSSSLLHEQTDSTTPTEPVPPAHSEPKNAPTKTRRRDPLFDAIATLAGIRDGEPIPKRQQSRVGGITNELRTLGVTADQLPAIIARYRATMPTGTTITPEAIAKHAPSLRPKNAGGRREGTWLDGGDPTRTPTPADITAGRFVEPSRFGDVA